MRGVGARGHADTRTELAVSAQRDQQGIAADAGTSGLTLIFCEVKCFRDTAHRCCG
jgi:hypothetical protein